MSYLTIDFPFPLVLVLSFVHVLEEFNSYFLSATYLSFHVVLQLGDLFIRPRHTALCSFCRGQLGPCAGISTNYTLGIQVPTLRPCPQLPPTPPVCPGGKVLSCLETLVLPQGQDANHKKGTNYLSVLPASW